MKQTPMYQLYASIAPRVEDWPRLLGKMGELMKQDFDYSKDLSSIKAPTMIVAGDAEMFPPARGRDVRAARWRQRRWRLGWFGNVECEARYPAGRDPLRDGLGPGARTDGHLVPRRARAEGSVIGEGT